MEWMMMMLGMIMGQCEYVCGSGILYVKKHAFSPPKTGCQEDQQQECVLCVCFGVRKLGRSSSHVLIMCWLFVNSFDETDHNMHGVCDLCSYLLLLYIMCREYYHNNIFIHNVLIRKINQRCFNIPELSWRTFWEKRSSCCFANIHFDRIPI